MEDTAATWATEADRKRDLRQRRIAEAKHRVWMFGHLTKDGPGSQTYWTMLRRLDNDDQFITRAREV